jgi:hypothetical protein
MQLLLEKWSFIYSKSRWLNIAFEMKQNETERVHFVVEIKYYRSNSVQTATLFKNLNDVSVCKLLDL